MEELREKANNYAEENVTNVLKEAFAKVYADGYHDGYKDCEEENAIDLRDGKTEFVDLGLPSGTLWSADYEKGSDGYKYMPYEKACNYSIPNLEQMKELLNICKLNFKRDSSKNVEEVQFIGPNGNLLCFTRTGYIEIEKIESKDYIGCFWIKENIEKLDKYVGRFSWNKEMYITTEYPGYKLPIRLVRTK